MRALAPDRVGRARRASTAPTTSPCTTTLVASQGCEDVLVRLKDEGRRLGIVTAKRRADRRARIRTGSRSRISSRRWSAATRRTATSPIRSRCCSRLDAAGRRARRGCAYVGDSPFDIRAAKAAGMYAVASDVGRHPRRASGSSPRSRTRSSTLAEELSRRPLGRSRRAPRGRAARRTRLPPLPLPRPRRPRDHRRGVRQALRRARRARGGASRARHAGLADAARRRAAVGQVPEGRAPVPDGLAREGHDRRGGSRNGTQDVCKRLGTSDVALRDRAEDRRALDQPDLRGRGLRARRDARRRLPRRGRDAEPADDQGDLDAHAAHGR